MQDEVDHIMELMVHAFDPHWGEAWNRRQVSDALTFPHTHAVLATEAGQVWAPEDDKPPVGFVMSRQVADEEELLLIAVHPKARSRGVGRALIEMLFANAAERGAARVFLEMRSNNPAEQLYRQVGFEPIGRRKDYYRLANGESLDAITFARDLNE